MTAKAAAIALMIECIIRRPGGTQVPFGHNAANATVYHFKPENGDLNDLSVPHVCEVTDQTHMARFLTITEGYRLYTPGQDATLPSQLGMSEQSNFKNEDPYADLINVDPEAADNDWLAGFSREVLKIGPTNKDKLREYLLKNTGQEADENDTANQIIRKILAARVAEEKLAHANAGGNGSIGT